MVSGSLAGDQAQKEREDDCADHCDTDGVDEASTARVSERAHDETTNDRADDADDDVTKCAVAAALHDLAGNKTSDQADDDPPENIHLCQPQLSFKIVRFHEGGDIPVGTALATAIRW